MEDDRKVFHLVSLSKKDICEKDAINVYAKDDDQYLVRLYDGTNLKQFRFTSKENASEYFMKFHKYNVVFDKKTYAKRRSL